MKKLLRFFVYGLLLGISSVGIGQEASSKAAAKWPAELGASLADSACVCTSGTKLQPPVGQAATIFNCACSNNQCVVAIEATSVSMQCLPMGSKPTVAK